MSHTFASRAGRWSARHRKTAILGWLGFVLAALVIGSAVGVNSPEHETTNVGEAGRADKIVQDAFPSYATESVMVQATDGGDARSPEVRAAVGAVVGAVDGAKGVREVRSPYAPGNAGQISEDGRSALVRYEVHAETDVQEDLVGPLTGAVDKVAAAHDGVRIGQFGGASANAALSEAISDDFKKAETLSLPITLIILVFAFGALVAAGVPLLLAISAVGAAIGLTSMISHLVPLGDEIASIILLVGMAVGVDYALFYLRREREERRRGASPEEALEIAAATSGRAVLVSGVTVIAAMSGLFLAGDQSFTGLGIGAVVVVAVAMIGSVTVLPAALSALGDKVDRGRIPFLHLRSGDGDSRAWGWILDRVLARPLVSALASAALLIGLTIPAFGLHTANTGTDGLPRSLEIMQDYDRMQAAFPGGQIPATVVVKAGDVRSIPVAAAIRQLRNEVGRDARFGEPVSVAVSPDATVATIDVPTVGTGSDDASVAAVEVLRERIVPATIGSVPGAEAHVTGLAAGSKDFNDLMKSRAPLVFGFVLAFAFMLLMVTFRSIVIPIKAIVLNLLSVGAAYGVLKLVFQDGHGEKLLGFESSGSVAAWLPMFLFVILFGLSMDYHVFILSRVREAYDRGMSTEDAVAHGIKQTAGVVTSAAAVMVAVFAIFATLSAIDLKMMGVGLATAVLIDATIVRAVLLPATMKLLGDWNWYLPRRLAWLPALAPHEPAAAPARA